MCLSRVIVAEMRPCLPVELTLKTSQKGTIWNWEESREPHTVRLAAVVAWRERRADCPRIQGAGLFFFQSFLPPESGLTA